MTSTTRTCTGQDGGLGPERGGQDGEAMLTEMMNVEMPMDMADVDDHDHDQPAARPRMKSGKRNDLVVGNQKKSIG